MAEIKCSVKKIEIIDGENILNRLPDFAFDAEKSGDNIGLFMATSLWNFGTRKGLIDKYLNGGIRAVNPIEFPKTLISYIAGEIASKLKLKGANITFSCGVSSGLDALIAGKYFMSRKEKNSAIIVGLDEDVIDRKESIVRSSIWVSLEPVAMKKQENLDKCVTGIEGFFERKRENFGLVRSLERLLKKQALEKEDISRVFISGKSGSNRFLKEKNAFHRLVDEPIDVCSLDYYCDPEKCNYSGLWPFYLMKEDIDKIAINRDRARKTKKLFLHLGEDSNSFCLLAE